MRIHFRNHGHANWYQKTCKRLLTKTRVLERGQDSLLNARSMQSVEVSDTAPTMTSSVIRIGDLRSLVLRYPAKIGSSGCRKASLSLSTWHTSTTFGTRKTQKHYHFVLPKRLLKSARELTIHESRRALCDGQRVA
jgi:hypothetical protein